jgi:RNA-directed DNA polymerase
MTTQLTGVAEKAKADRKLRFTSLAHLLTPQFLAETWRMLNKKGAPGVNGETVEHYECNLEERVQDLYTRVRGKRYHAPPVRRVEIPKGDGTGRVRLFWSARMAIGPSAVRTMRSVRCVSIWWSIT